MSDGDAKFHKRLCECGRAYDCTHFPGDFYVGACYCGKIHGEIRDPGRIG